MEKIKIVSTKKAHELPKTAGVYLFFDSKKIIYIGKAINIHARVKNHFSQPSYRDHLFIKKVNRIGFIETNSEIEALVLEAQLIRKHLPKFNVVWKDGKNYFYVAIADSKKPVIYITHQKNSQDTTYIGPFIEGAALKKTMKYLRRVFPYYTSARHPARPCTWCHLGLCPGPTPDVKEYQKNIKKLILVLEGKRSAVIKMLKKEMKERAQNRDFERAAASRDQMLALERVMSHTHVIERTQLINAWENIEKVMQGLLNMNGSVSRIECYDISNIQGKLAVGSMVVFKDGKPDKSQYRKFRIRMKNEPNDIAMLKEIFERRFNNPQWPFPQIMLIDGGIAQLNAAINMREKLCPVLKAFKTGHNRERIKRIKIISIAKGRQELFIEGRSEPIPLKQLPQEVYNLVKHLDDEAHRFAVTYHKKLRKKNILGA